MDSETMLIRPFRRNCNAEAAVPGSKSISNRALILAVMCGGKVKLKGLLESEDVDLMQRALQNLDVKIQKEKNYTIIEGTKGKIKKNECFINVGNAGTIARFLTCLLAAQKKGTYTMDGTKAMRERPMVELLESLCEMGCSVHYEKEYGKFPFLLKPRGIVTEYVKIDARKSGQSISGILMQCTAKRKKSEIDFGLGTVSVPFIEMTLKMMNEFSKEKKLQYQFKDNKIILSEFEYRKDDFTYFIEPDATAASYFLTLPLVVGGKCKVMGMSESMLQGDIAYYEVLQRLGAKVFFDANGIICSYDRQLGGGTFDFRDISDTFLSLAAISPLLSQKLEIYGIEHTRKQETDRVGAMAAELSKLGQKVIEKDDRLIIHPNLNKLKDLAKDGVEINTYKDHRFAMSFSILGCFDLYGNGKPWMKIIDPYCCAKTFPTFFNCLNTVRERSEA